MRGNTVRPAPLHAVVALAAAMLAGLAASGCASEPGGVTAGFGGTCAGHADCESMLCLSGRCTRTCTSDCECPMSYACRSAGTFSVCAPDTNGCTASGDAGPTPRDAFTPPRDAFTPPRDAWVPPGGSCRYSTPTVSCGPNYDCGDRCCQPDHPYYCPGSDLCYSTQSAAVADCGDGVCVSCVPDVPHDAGPPDAGPPPPRDHVVTCTGSVTRAEWCECNGDTDTGPTRFSGTCIPDASFAPMICCASSGFPSSGSCSCWLSQPWRCQSFSSSCACSNYYDPGAGVPYTTVCDNVPDTRPWRCCASGGHCNCERDGAACGAGEREVSNCTDYVALGLQAARTSCPSGQHQVSSCSGGGSSGSCASDSDCPGSCTGSDPVCCPSCIASGSSHYCGQYCCSSSGVCF